MIFAMGIYGAGNSGAAVNKFIDPALVVAFGLMYGVVWVSLIWMSWTEVRRIDYMGKDAEPVIPQNCFCKGLP